MRPPEVPVSPVFGDPQTRKSPPPFGGEGFGGEVPGAGMANLFRLEQPAKPTNKNSEAAKLVG